MADRVDQVKRSEIMSRIRSVNTKPELMVRKFLFSKGLRYRLYDKLLPAKPDIKLTKYATLIFVNGCFWHGHKNCKAFAMPKTNEEFWCNKIEANIKRDKKQVLKLRKMGWHVYTVWACGLTSKNRQNTLARLLNRILMNYKRVKVVHRLS